MANKLLINSKGKAFLNKNNKVVGYKAPSGTLTVTANGTYDVRKYEQVSVQIRSLQSIMDKIKSVNGLFAYFPNEPDIISRLNFENVSDFCRAFKNSELKTVKLNTRNMQSCSGMFRRSWYLGKIDITYFNTNTKPGVYNSHIFDYCTTLKCIIIRGFGENYKVSGELFNGCYYLLGEQHWRYNPNGEIGYIYIPREYLTSIPDEPYWNVIQKSQYRALEDYIIPSEDGSIDILNGEFDYKKAGLK